LDRLPVGETAQSALADAAEEKNTVVGRDREDERCEDERDGQIECVLTPVVKKSLETSVLEDKDQRPEGRGERQCGRDKRDERSDDRTREEEENEQRRTSEQRKGDRQVRTDCAPLVPEGCSVAADVEPVGAVERPESTHGRLRRSAERGVG